MAFVDQWQWQWTVLQFTQFILIFILLALSILFQISSTFKYYFKLYLFYTLITLIGLGTCFYSLPRPKNPGNHSFLKACTRLFMGRLLGIKLSIRGEELLEKDEPAIVVVNHQSILDLIPQTYFWPKNCVSMAKQELLLFGPIGIAAWLCGTIFINRCNHQSALKTMESAVKLIKTKKIKMLIFAEGTRNYNGSMLPFKKGAFHLAVNCQVPIIPVVYSSYEKFYSLAEKRFNEGHLLVEVLPPIPTTGLTSEDVTALAEKTRNHMLQCFERINMELQ